MVVTNVNATSLGGAQVGVRMITCQSSRGNSMRDSTLILARHSSTSPAYCLEHLIKEINMQRHPARQAFVEEGNEVSHETPNLHFPKHLFTR